MNQHQRFRERLAYRSELSPKQERQLEEHLAGCVECRRIAEDYARQVQLLRALPDHIPPRTLRLAALHRAHQLPMASRRSFGRPAWGGLAVGVATLVVVAAATLINRPHDNSRSAVQRRATIATSAPLGSVSVPPTLKASGKPAPSARHGGHRSIPPVSGRQTPPPSARSQSQSHSPVPIPASGKPYVNPPPTGSVPVLSQALASTATPPPVANTPAAPRRTPGSPSPAPSPPVHRRRPVSKIPVLISAPPTPASPSPVPLFSGQPSTSTPSLAPPSSPVPQQTASPPAVRRTIAASLRPTQAAPIGAAAQATTTPTASPVEGPAVSAVPTPTKTFPSASIIAPIASPSPSTTTSP